MVNADGDGLDSNGYATITGGTITVNGPTTERQWGARRQWHLHHLRRNPAGRRKFRDGSGPGHRLGPGLGGGDVHQHRAGRHRRAHRGADGTEVASFTATKAFSSVVYSSAAITSGATYSVYTGGSVAGDDVGGLSSSGDLTGATAAGTFTAGTAPTGGMGMGGSGMGGGRPPAGG